MDRKHFAVIGYIFKDSVHVTICNYRALLSSVISASILALCQLFTLRYIIQTQYPFPLHDHVSVRSYWSLLFCANSVTERCVASFGLGGVQRTQKS